MNAFQWFFVAFCAFQLCCAVLRFRRSRQVASLVFALVWLTGLVLLLQPELSTELAHAIGIGRGADLVLYFLSIMFLWGHYENVGFFMLKPMFEFFCKFLFFCVRGR